MIVLPWKPQTRRKFVVPHRMVEGVVVNEVVSPQVLNHVEIGPHVIARPMLIENMTADVLHAETEVEIPILVPLGDKRHIVAEPTHKLSGVMFTKMIAVMANPTILVVTPKHCVAVSQNTKLAP